MAAKQIVIDHHRRDFLYDKGRADRQEETGELMPEFLYHLAPKQQLAEYDVWLAGYRGEPKPND